MSERLTPNAGDEAWLNEVEFLARRFATAESASLHRDVLALREHLLETSINEGKAGQRAFDALRARHQRAGADWQTVVLLARAIQHCAHSGAASGLLDIAEWCAAVEWASGAIEAVSALPSPVETGSHERLVTIAAAFVRAAAGDALARGAVECLLAAEHIYDITDAEHDRRELQQRIRSHILRIVHCE
jgi:hypothetical protein